VPASVLAVALRGVVSQRLVRLVCRRCARWREPTEDEHQLFTAMRLDIPHFREGAGCPACRGTGYHDRAAIAEILRVDRAVERAIATGADASAIAAAAPPPYEPMARDGLRKVGQGHTTVREILRVAEWRG
jgi:type II secretory ATPase GspE/PulE/Tfp pilus assembly ATPase PilB-like protein